MRTETPPLRLAPPLPCFFFLLIRIRWAADLRAHLRFRSSPSFSSPNLWWAGMIVKGPGTRDRNRTTEKYRTQIANA